MFEQQCAKNNNEETRRFSKLKRSLPRPAAYKRTEFHAHRNHFQDILDFIDDMTDEKFSQKEPLEIHGLKQCRGHRMGEGCSCLGKSKCYIVHKKLQEADCSVSKGRERFSSGETLSSRL